MSISEVLEVWKQICDENDIKWYLYRETLLCAEGYHRFHEELPYAQIIIHTSKRFDNKLIKSISSLPCKWRVKRTGTDTLCVYDQTKSVVLSVEELNVSKPSNFEDEISLKLEWFEAETKVICADCSYPVFSGYKEYLSEKYGDYENGLFDDVGCGLSVEDKSELKHHHQKCKEALQFINELAKQHDLRYYLIAGSVLGAVRHKGFIPWDDDIDIGIRIEDREKFESVVKQYLPEEFSFIEASPNHSYPRMFSKICYEGRCCIDLWPLVPTYTDEIRSRVTWYIGKVLRKLHYKKIGYTVSKFDFIAKALSKPISDTRIMWWAHGNERLFLKQTPPAYINLYSVYSRNKELILREWLENSTYAEFEGLQVPIVGDTDVYLKHLYGDYMKKPVPWKRASKHFSRFSQDNQMCYVDK